MDMYTVFAMAMSLLGGLALTLALVIYLDARKSVSQNRHIMMHWCESVLTQQDSNRLLQQKIDQELAQRIKNLETYRANHAHRINAVEDLVDLLNSDGTVEVDHYSEGQGWDRVKMNISDVQESDIPRGSAARAWEVDAFDRTDMIEERNEIALREWDDVTPAKPSDPNPLDAEMQAIVERRFLQGL